MLLCAFIAWFIGRSITRPLNDAVELARRVAAGDLTSEDKPHAADETGEMMQALQDGQVQKTYEALVWQAPSEDAGIWNFPIARKGGESLLREVREDGQAAKTRFRILQRFPNCSRLELEPITGRTHQLRVHCAHIGCPILGDPQYGTAESLALSKRFSLPHQQLCAVELTFPHPLTGEQIRLQSEQRIIVPK